MRAFGYVLVGTLLAVTLVARAEAEQRWQCGGGLTVPLQGSRADRQAACRDAAALRDNPDAPVTQEQAERLRKQIKDAEKQYNVDIKVDGMDRK